MVKPEWIDPFLESSYELFVNHDPKSHLPFDAWGLHPHYNDLWLDKLGDLVDKFKEKGYKISDYLDYFPNTSSVRFSILMNTIHYQTSKIDQPELITKILDFLVEALEQRTQTDPFALNLNIDLNQDKLEELLKTRPFHEVSLDESKEIGKILVALASLTHGLYNDWCTDYDYEITGPYKVDGKTVLIRSFPDLSPKDVWPQINWPYKSISVITEYKNLKAQIKFVGCHIIYDGNSVEELARVNFLLDDQEIKTTDELKVLRDKLMIIASEQYELYLNMDFEAQKIKYLEQENYQFKKLFDLVGIDWRPSQEMIDRVKGKDLIEDVFPSYEMTPEVYKENFGGQKIINAYREV